MACFPPVIGEEDFNLNHNHNLSEFYLSELSLKCQNDNEPIVLLNTESVKRKRKRKKSDKSFDVDEGRAEWVKGVGVLTTGSHGQVFSCLISI